MCQRSFVCNTEFVLINCFNREQNLWCGALVLPLAWFMSSFWYFINLFIPFYPLKLYWILFYLAFCYSGTISHKCAALTEANTHTVCVAFYQFCALGNVQIDVCGNFLQQKCALMAASVILHWRIMHTNNARLLAPFFIVGYFWLVSSVFLKWIIFRKKKQRKKNSLFFHNTFPYIYQFYIYCTHSSHHLRPLYVWAPIHSSVHFIAGSEPNL